MSSDIIFGPWTPGAGLVLADHTDVVLRKLSEPWLAAAWNLAGAFLRSEGINGGDFVWGELHGGVAVLPCRLDSPLDHLGFLSPQLDRWSERELIAFEERAAMGLSGEPALRAGRSYRTRTFGTPGHDPAFGLRLIDAVLLDSRWEWLAPCDSSEAPHPHIGRKLAVAFAARDLQALASALELARATYSPDGWALARRTVAARLADEGIAPEGVRGLLD